MNVDIDFISDEALASISNGDIFFSFHPAKAGSSSSNTSYITRISAMDFSFNLSAIDGLYDLSYSKLYSGESPYNKLCSMAFVHHNLFTLNYPSFLFPSPDYQHCQNLQDLQQQQDCQDYHAPESCQHLQGLGNLAHPQNLQNYYQSNVNYPLDLHNLDSSFHPPFHTSLGNSLDKPLDKPLGKSLGDPFHNLSHTSLDKPLDKPFVQPSLLPLDIFSTTYPNPHLDILSHLDNNHSISDFFSDFNIDFNTDFIGGFNSGLSGDFISGFTNGLTGDFIDDSNGRFDGDSNTGFDGDSTSEPSDVVIDGLNNDSDIDSNIDSSSIPLSPAFLKFLLDFRPFFLTSFRLVEFNRQAESILLQHHKQHEQHQQQQQQSNNNSSKTSSNNLIKTPIKSPRTYYQIKVSFPTKIPTNVAFSVIKPYLKENFPNARVLAVVHQNTPHTHCHIHLQSIEIDPNNGKPNGKKLHFGSAKFQSLDLAWARSYASKFGNHLLEKHLEKKLIHKIDRHNRLELKLNQSLSQSIDQSPSQSFNQPFNQQNGQQQQQLPVNHQQQLPANSTHPERSTNHQQSINLQPKQIKDKAYFIEQEIRRLGLHYVYDSQTLAHHLSSQTSSSFSTSRATDLSERAAASTERSRTLSDPTITSTERTIAPAQRSIASATQPATSAERPTNPSPRTSFSSNSQQSYQQQQQQFNQQQQSSQQSYQQQSQQQPTITTSTSATEPSIADYQQRINDQQRTISSSEPTITNLQQSIARSQHLIDYSTTQADQLSNLLNQLGNRAHSRPRDSFQHSDRGGSDAIDGRYGNDGRNGSDGNSSRGGNDGSDGQTSNKQLNDRGSNRQRDDDFFPSR